MILEAKKFAIIAHEAVGQKRKYTGEPYWYHLDRVAFLTDAHSPKYGREEIVAAAWLHDVVEDTHVSFAMVRDYFGAHVEVLVAALTNNKHVPRDERKALEMERFRSAPSEACTIKCADILDNGRCFIKSGDKPATLRFMTEKAALLPILKDGASPELWKMTKHLVDNYWNEHYDL